MCYLNCFPSKTVRRARASLRQIYSLLPVRFLGLARHSCVPRGCSPRCGCPAGLRCWENTLFAFPSFETASGNSRSDSQNQQVLLGSSPVIPVTSSRKKSSSCAPIFSPSARKTSMSRASEACLISAWSFGSPWGWHLRKEDKTLL